MIGGVPVWPPSALESVGLLYRPLQDLEVYVEDKDSEVFYLELLGRLIPSGKRIKKIIPLNGRGNVVDLCKRYNDPSPALFLIDGDLDLTLKIREIGLKNLFQLKSYCIENYLFCLIGSREIIVETSGKILPEKALTTEEWETFFNYVSEPLRELFLVFAAARVLAPTLKTVSLGYPSISTQKIRKRGPEPDLVKIFSVIEAIKIQSLQFTSEEIWLSTIEQIRENAKDIQTIDMVSGKDFLLPMLDMFIRSKGGSTASTESLMFRLARHCSLNRLNELGAALQSVLDGDVIFSS
ncbi:DUF4435 domain-containing protein [Pseudomonas lini]|uniref:DUF4435 domain-containing protein n=1 Tax=Pseudomonas TaxID=286 RepID=UPI0005798EBF|nr:MULTISPECIES: DUF4435 domain-containing protein [Pseudomonas]NSX08534.1 DUF4435 domain-containing protein [Pseudomonas lini]